MLMFDSKLNCKAEYGYNTQEAINLRRKPFTGASLAKSVVLSRPPLENEAGIPRLCSAQRALRIGKNQAKAFGLICGLEPGRELNAVLLHSLCFAHHLHLLTLGQMPLRAHTMLQVRNHIVLLADIPIGKPMELRTAITGFRYTAKGVEVDIDSRAYGGGELAWANSCAYFFPVKHAQSPDTMPEAAAFKPLVTGLPAGEWSMKRNGWRFARLSGDYNGIHTSRRYARLMGFSDAFSHSQPVLANCLHHMLDGGNSQAIRLDAALKGPVFYGQKVTLQAGENGRFDLMAQGNDRPVIVGRLSTMGRSEVDQLRKDKANAF